jgi:PAS domain S-box-containing protein
MLLPTEKIPVEFGILAQRAPLSTMFVDRHGIICFVNDWHLQHFARGLHERHFFLGRSVFSLPGIVTSGVGEALRPVLEGREILLEKIFTSEFSGGHSGYQTIRAIGTSTRGEPCGAVIIREDVTRWVELEKNCRVEHVRLRELLNASQDSAMLMDVHGRLVTMNDEATRRLDMTVEDLIGRSIYKLVEPDAALYRRAMDEKVLTTSKPVEYEETLGERTYRVSINPIEDVDGRISHLVSFSKDITARKQMERAMERAKEHAEASFAAKTQFLANISHELRTPLNGILGAVQLADTESLDEDQHELWSIVRESGERLLKTVNSLLDLADISSHALQPAMRGFDLRKTLSGVVNSFQVQARLKGLDLLVEVDPDVPEYVVGDEFRLRVILGILLTNSIQCTSQGAIRVNVLTLREEDLHETGGITCVGGKTLMFTVEDTGLGIAPERLDSIFDSFSLAEDALTKTHSRAGVGLAIARSLVELLGGKIWVRSALGKGSVFRFTAAFWPRPTENQEEPDARGEQRSGSGARILVVDDERISRLNTSFMLRKMGYEVTCAADGQEALKALMEEECDAVFMDIQMPVMDGITAAGLIRNGELPGVDRHIPILALTAYSNSRDRIRLLRAGMDGLIAKPFKSQDLADALGKALR